MHFSFSKFFSVFCNITGPTMCTSFSLIFSVSRHIPGPAVCISHIRRFSVFLPYSRSYTVHISFSKFFSFLAIFQVLQCPFLIFHGFQFTCHISGLTVCISHIPYFSVFLAIFQALQCAFLLFKIFSFLAIFWVLECTFLILQVFQ